MSAIDRGWDKRRLRRLLGAFFVALIIPTALLSWQAYSRLKWESFHRYQLLAEELVGRIDQRLSRLIAEQEARSFADYGFLVVEGPPSANYLQRSPLAEFPIAGDLPGLIGHFQIDAQGRFSTPLLPDADAGAALAYGISDRELAQRQAAKQRLFDILGHQRLVSTGTRPAAAAERAPPPAAEPTLAQKARPPAGASLARERRAAPEPDPAAQEQVTQAVFDQLEEQPGSTHLPKQLGASGRLGRVDELKLEQPFAGKESRLVTLDQTPRKDQDSPRRGARKELSVLPLANRQASEEDESAPPRASATPRVTIFESAIDPFGFGLLESGHFVLYRKVWRNGQRYIQGALIDPRALLRQFFEQPFRDTALAGMSRLAIAFEGNILSALGGSGAARYLYSAEQLSGSLLYRARLSAPLSRLELVFSVTHLPAGAGAAWVTWVTLILTAILSGGLFLIYRLGAKQIELNTQQRNFVSAISHELKTPLTSIRMYSEILREGWADEQRKHDYYEFIHTESERLSRLIANVLQLARMNRDELPIEPRPIALRRLFELIDEKISSHLERADFTLQLDCPDSLAEHCIEVDEDAFIQILINLTDNAVKFAAKAPHKRIEIGGRILPDGRRQLSVRDHGPGIPKNQMKKIFLLFYRSESELTRETVGTGIGLALVRRLMGAMHGTVEVVNRHPGAEFQLHFPPPSAHAL